MTLLTHLAQAQSWAAQKHQCFIFARPVSEEALELIAQGAVAKPYDVVLKTQKEGPLSGYILAPEGERFFVLRKGHAVLSDQKGRPLTSDLDIVQMFFVKKEPETLLPAEAGYGKISAQEHACAQSINEQFTFNLQHPSLLKVVRHGPLDRILTLDLNKLNYPILVSTPEGIQRWLYSAEQYRVALPEHEQQFFVEDIDYASV